MKGSFAKDVPIHFKVKLSGNNSRIFWPKCWLLLFVFFGCYGWPWLSSSSPAMTRGERSVKRKKEAELKSYKDHCSLSSVTHPLGITHTESLFAGYLKCFFLSVTQYLCVCPSGKKSYLRCSYLNCHKLCKILNRKVLTLEFGKNVR